MKIKKDGKIISLTESDLQRIVKKILKEDKEIKNVLNEQGAKDIFDTIPADTTISVNNNLLLIKADKGKIKANYSVEHNQIGEMDAIKVDFDKKNGYLELTLSIPYGKGVFVKPKIEDPKKKEKMKETGIYAQYIKGESWTSNDKLYLKVNLNKNKKALDAIKNATDEKQIISLGEGFTLNKS